MSSSSTKPVATRVAATKTSTPSKSSSSKGSQPPNQGRIRAHGAAKKPAASSSKKDAAPKKSEAAAAAAPPPAAASKPEEIKNPVRQLKKAEVQSVLAEDKDETIRKANKPVLVVDNKSAMARQYLTYTDKSTLVDGRNPIKLTPEQIRLGVLSCIRFGKIYVVDMEGVAEGMFDELRKQFDLVTPGLLDNCMDRSIAKDADKLKPLKRDSDGDSYSDWYYSPEEMEKFYFVIVSSNPDHSEAFKAKFTLFSVED